ncbi:AAA family ATPase [Thermodesulfobacteriota bacterium]
MEKFEREFDLESYRSLSVSEILRQAILTRLRKGEDVFPDIDGREDTKSDLIRAILSGSHPYLISEEGTGKTRLARSLARLLPPVPAVKGCPYHDDPKWEADLLCNGCMKSENLFEQPGIEFIPGEARFSRIQGNEYTNEAKLLGLKDIQAIASGASPSDPSAFIGTGIFRANRGILMVDELPAIRTKVQVLLHPLLEEKKAVLEEYNWERFVDLVLIATGNPSGFSHVNEIPRPLLDRLEMIFMELPDEGIEKEIILKEGSAIGSNEYRRQNALAETIPDFTIDDSFLEPRVITPWWALEVLNKTVRYSRECPNLEKKPSIRGGTKAYAHTVSSVEMEDRNVATLKDVFLGLRLALRGRIGLLPDFIDFDNPEKTIKKSDQVVEDMVRDVIRYVCNEIFAKVELDKESFGNEITGISDKKLEGMELRTSKDFPELGKVLDWMLGNWQSKMPGELCEQYARDVFNLKDDIEESIKKEYIDSAFSFVAAGAAASRIIKEDMLSVKIFIPKEMAL